MDAQARQLRTLNSPRLLVVSLIALLTGIVWANASRQLTAVDVAGSQQAVAMPLPPPTRVQLHVPQMVRMEVTAYCPCEKCCGSEACGVTASGKTVAYDGGRFIAADTKVLPFGTRLSIPGYHDGHPVEVIDRGGAIRGNRIDVFFPTHQEAVEWGRKTLQVQVLN